MPKKYKRHCDFCGEQYTGEGKRYCSNECHLADRRASDFVHELPKGGKDVEPEVHERNGKKYVTVMGSRTIRTPKQLFDAVGLDSDEWQIGPLPRVKKWDVAMKFPGEDPPVRVTELFYVAMTLTRKAESAVPAPVVLKVTRPKRVKLDRQKPFTSLHFGDVHMPNHEPAALSIMFQVMDMVNPDIVVDHGDTLDFHELSKHPKNPKERVSAADSIHMGAEFLGVIHAMTPDARHLWLEGNHEARLRKQIWALAENRTAGEILTIPEVADTLRLPHLLGIEALGWETYEYPEHYTLFDKLILTHGNCSPQSGAAKSEYGRYGKSGMSGHTHRRAVFETRNHHGFHAWWEMGLLGRIHEGYVAHANWQQGFNVVTWSEDRKNFGVEEVRIHFGKAYFRGRLLTGDPKCFEHWRLENIV